MADSENHPTIIVDDRPVAVRRKRSIIVGPNLRSRINSHASKSGCHSLSTPPATPKRSKKRVRFSNPRPGTELESASSGLTPFVRRTEQPSPQHCLQSVIILHLQLFGIAAIMAYRYLGPYSSNHCDRYLMGGLRGG
ncbi:uncharacterized protein K444DRAFT_620105 [Hyaloscypha bicolor E]|uniref:Uncharacterized protein n=1 Tax=Hyaloscypha bicolor E TaxID=1095630 RepID=A0A2J6SNW0_9HELO|nr:uncharacterized protein K444DRAFT_620105 [Hyaloscypha bicolor E]PMD52461.1 hypothetical protein K444DRAFT_620105 [Hyaloscypha bicolor E]